MGSAATTSDGTTGAGQRQGEMPSAPHVSPGAATDPGLRAAVGTRPRECATAHPARRDRPRRRTGGARRNAAEDTLRQLPPADIEVTLTALPRPALTTAVQAWSSGRDPGIHRKYRPVGKYTSSYQAELHALTPQTTFV